MAIDIPDLTGQVALVTGGNSGIGDICVRQMAQAGARVFLLARSADKAQAAIASLRAADVAAAGRVEHIQCDLASLASVKKAAEDIIAKTDRLDVCLNNAGVMAMPYTFTEDGLEMQIGTNVVGHYLLTLLLLPLLVKTSLRPEHAERSVRIVHVSSMGHKSPLSTKDWSSLESVNQRGGRVEAAATWYRYGTSKTGNIQLANRFSALLKSLGAEHVYNLSLHPGVIKTNLTNGPIQSYGALAGGAIRFMTRFITTPEDGARTSLYAATSAEVDAKKLDAAYLVPTGKLAQSTAYSRDEQKGDEVMAFCASFVKEKVGVDAEAIKAEVKQILAAK